MNANLHEIKSQIYDKCSLEISDFKNEAEGLDYDACQFQLDGKHIICRSSKITSKKVGQFVTFWKRNTAGITKPYSEAETIDFYVINVKDKDRFGQFVFPKYVLINKGIISTDTKDGKRGFRVYPKWDIVQSKQAEKTQKWQVDYFYEIDEHLSLSKVLELYKTK